MSMVVVVVALAGLTLSAMGGYDYSISTPVEITGTAGGAPDVSGDRIVWSASGTVYSYSISNPGVTTLASGREPSIDPLDEDRVAYTVVDSQNPLMNWIDLWDNGTASTVCPAGTEESPFWSPNDWLYRYRLPYLCGDYLTCEWYEDEEWYNYVSRVHIGQSRENVAGGTPDD